MASRTAWILLLTLGCAVQLMSATAEPPSDLSCVVTQQPDGSFLYHLSQPPSSSQCKTCWEDHKKTVIARDADFDPKLVHSLTNQSLTLKDCLDYMHYKRDCEVWKDAHCNINCSLILDLKYGLPTPVNSTLICIVKSWCLDQLEFGLGVAAIIIVICVLVVLFRWIFCKFRRGPATTSAQYTNANEQIDMVQHKDII